MAKYEIGHGIDEYITRLGNLQRKAPHICGQAVYEGAKVVADAVDAAAASLPVAEQNVYTKTGEKVKGVTPRQKAGLRSSKNGGGLGIAKMKNDGGFFNVSVGYHGYNREVTKAYPNGQPNAMIARSVNSGTYFRQKDPFFDRAIRKSKPAAEAAMARTADQLINEIMK